jgi:tRNA-uridine 2-sulfurtransferase
MTRKKAVVAMSGGVDSSVSAALLVEAGYDVTGIMLKLWRGGTENTDSGCCSVGAADDARRVADLLGIPFYVFNFAERFEDTVISDFHRTYAAGQTPNPCVRCNQWIKFDLLLERARGLGADVLATGHYARVEQTRERYRLLRGADPAKDQSYVLWMLTQEALRSVQFPVGHLEKAETRRIAAELGLRTATKPDSQEICFVRGGDVGSYVRDHVTSEPGEFVDADGNSLGRHSGFGHYTIGQRKGLGIALGEPVYVTDIDADANRVVVGARSELAVSGLRLEEVSFVSHAPVEGTWVRVQHRAHGDANTARIRTVARGSVDLAYESDVLAVAPGQSAALYSIDDPNELIGGGIIASTVKADSARSSARASVA